MSNDSDKDKNFAMPDEKHEEANIDDVNHDIGVPNPAGSFYESITSAISTTSGSAFQVTSAVQTASENRKGYQGCPLVRIFRIAFKVRFKSYRIR